MKFNISSGGTKVISFLDSVKSVKDVQPVLVELTDPNCLESVDLDLQPSLQESIFGTEGSELNIFISPDDAGEEASFELDDI